MLLLGEKLLNMPIMGIQTGTRLAITKSPVIDPANLTIIAYEVDGPRVQEHPTYLRIADVRELSDIGMIVDSSDEFVMSTDIISLKKILDLNFHLTGLRVIDEDKRHIGKIKDYVVETGYFTILQIIVEKSFPRNFTEPEVIIHRSQILEIDDDTITVESTRDKKAVTATPATKLTFLNPFRQSQNSPQTENPAASSSR